MFVRNDEIKTKKSLGIAHFLKTNEKKILPVSGSGIQTHNLSNTSLLQQPLDHCCHPFFSYVYRSFPFLFPISFDFDSLISVFPFSVSAITGGEEVPNGGNGATQNLKNQRRTMQHQSWRQLYKCSTIAILFFRHSIGNG